MAASELSSTERIYDCAVIGAGPAGLSAALYMGRMRRSVVVIDDNEGRSNWFQLNRNYIGFPDGVHARNLREIGREQCERYGVEFLSTCAKRVRAEGEGYVQRRFYIDTTSGPVVARTLIFAMGVVDQFPQFTGSNDCIGKSMFWCIICDGYETIGKHIVVLGHNNRAASLALELLVFTDKVTLISWDKPFNFSEERMNTLKEHGVVLHDSRCTDFNCAETGFVCSVILDGGTQIDLDGIFVAQRMQPNSQLADQLGVMLDEHGFIVADVEQATNVEAVYAAGDITKLYNHQVSSAVHEGGMAAAAANYYLYEDWQRD